MPFLEDLVSRGFIECAEHGQYRATTELDAWREEQLISLADRLDAAHSALDEQAALQLHDALAAPHTRFAVWGANALGRSVARALQQQGRTVSCFIDSNPEKHSSTPGRTPIMGFEDALSLPTANPQAVIVCSRSYKKEIEQQIAGRLPVFHIFQHDIYETLDAGAPTPPHPLAIFSLPKSGTHLAFRALSLMPGVSFEKRIFFVNQTIDPDNIVPFTDFMAPTRPGRFICEHAPWCPPLADFMREKNFKGIFLLRDPRDVITSLYFFLLFQLKDHPFSLFFRETFPTEEERLMAMITGEKCDAEYFGYVGMFFRMKNNHFGRRLAPYLKWMQEDCIYTTRYEWLVGAKGGGDDEIQKREIRNIAQFAGIDITETQIDFIAEHLYSSGAATFRKGTIGDWKNHFTDAHKEAFKAGAGEQLIELGYEKDLNW